MNVTPTTGEGTVFSGTMLDQAITAEKKAITGRLNPNIRQAWENYFVWDRVTAPYGDWNQYNPWGQSAPAGQNRGRVPLSKYTLN